jgi:hypothetical protein
MTDLLHDEGYSIRNCAAKFMPSIYSRYLSALYFMEGYLTADVAFNPFSV